MDTNEGVSAWRSKVATAAERRRQRQDAGGAAAAAAAAEAPSVLTLAKAVRRAAPHTSCSSSLSSPVTLLVGRLASRRVNPVPAVVGETGAVPWSLYLEDETAAVRAVFLDPPPPSLLQQQQEGEGEAGEAVLVLEEWQCLRGQGQASPSSSSSAAAGDREAYCLEVSAWRLAVGYCDLGNDDDEEAPRAKRARREEALPVYAEGLWATGVAAVVSPVLKGRKRRRSSSSTSSASTTTAMIRTPSRALVLLHPHRGGGATMAVILQGDPCLRCQPCLRPGRAYHFPLVRRVDPAATGEEELLDLLGEGCPPLNGSGRGMLIFVALLPPVEVAVPSSSSGARRGLPFHHRHGVHTYPTHAPFEPPETPAHPAAFPSVPSFPSTAAAADEEEGDGPSCLQARVVHFEGVIKAAHRNGKYDMVAPPSSSTSTSSSSSLPSRIVPVLLGSPALSVGLGAGLRKGARVRFWNLHPVALGGQVQALGGCLWTHVEILAFAPPPPPAPAPAPAPATTRRPAPAAAPYLLPSNGAHRHRSLAFLAWTIRLRGQLQRKVFGTATLAAGNGAGATGAETAISSTEAAELERWLYAWAKRISGIGDGLRMEPPLHEALLHATAGACPSVFGGLPSSHLPNHDSLPAFALLRPGLSPPSLAEVPTVQSIRSEIAARCRRALLGGNGKVDGGGGGGWWAALERAGQGRRETLDLGLFDVRRRSRGGGDGGDDDAEDEEEEEENVALEASPRAVLMGLLSRRRGEAARLVDATGSLPIHLTLAIDAQGSSEQRLVLWREDAGGARAAAPSQRRSPPTQQQSGQQPAPFVATQAGPAAEAAVAQREQEAIAAGLAAVRALPWSPSVGEAEAAGAAKALPASSAAQMVVGRGVGRRRAQGSQRGAIRILVDIVSWHRQEAPALPVPVPLPLASASPPPSAPVAGRFSTCATARPGPAITTAAAREAAAVRAAANARVQRSRPGSAAPQRPSSAGGAASSSSPSAAAGAVAGDGCLDISFPVGDAQRGPATVTVRVRPFLLVEQAALLPLAEPADTKTGSAQQQQQQPPPNEQAEVDWGSTRLVPVLEMEAARGRADEYRDCPPVRLLVLVKRVESYGNNNRPGSSGSNSSSGSNGGGGSSPGRVLLVCRDANAEAPAVARLFLYASHQTGGLCAPEPFPGTILLARGLRCRAMASRRVDLYSSPGCSIVVAGYRPLSPPDRHLALLTADERYSRAAASNRRHDGSDDDGDAEEEEEVGAALARTVPLGLLCGLGRAHRVHFGLVRLSVVVVCFHAPALALRCPACRGFADRCGGRCGVALEPWWEVRCTVDDGTGQANVMADGELAVKLLRVEPARRRRLEAALFQQGAGAGAAAAGPMPLPFNAGGNDWARKEAVGEWLWAELFRDPSERARRLRRLQIVAQEILLRTGKGDGRPLSQQRVRRCEWVDGVRRDVPHGSGSGASGTTTWSLHMPALKALHVAEASLDPRREAHEALAACTAAGLGGSGKD